MAEHSADAPSALVQDALRQRDELSEAERAKYGERLNTVVGTRCPDCRQAASMSVHPGHRVYHPCGCAHELPPLPVNRTYEARRRSGAKPKGAAK